MRSLRTIMLVLLGMLFLAGPAFAQTGITTDAISGNWRKLTEEQKAALAAQIAQQADQNKTTPLGDIVPTKVEAQDVEPWLVLIDKVGQGLVRLAKDLGVTASFGGATCPRDGLTPETLFQAADAALYRSKAFGRNQTMMGVHNAH